MLLEIHINDTIVVMCHISRHDDNDDNGMARHVVGYYVMLCHVMLERYRSILEIAKCRLLHSIRRTKISHLRKQSLYHFKY